MPCRWLGCVFTEESNAGTGNTVLSTGAFLPFFGPCHHHPHHSVRTYTDFIGTIPQPIFDDEGVPRAPDGSLLCCTKSATDKVCQRTCPQDILAIQKKTTQQQQQQIEIPKKKWRKIRTYWEDAVEASQHEGWVAPSTDSDIRGMALPSIGEQRSR